MRFPRTLLAVLALAPAAGAQAVRPIGGNTPPPTSPGSAVMPNAGGPPLAGLVTDSLGHTVLANATVVVVGTTFHATSDQRGLFRFDSLPPGHYRVGFFHPTLDTLGISAPVKAVDIHEGQSAIIDLAIPSMGTIIGMLCSDSVRRAAGSLLIGSVRDAGTRAPLPGAYVVARWTELSIAGGGVHKQQQAINSTTDANGNYHLCGVPTEQQVSVQARSGDNITGWVEIMLDRGVLSRRDFTVSTEPAGAAVAAAAPATTAPGVAPGADSAARAVKPTTVAGTKPAASVRVRGGTSLTGVVRTTSGKPAAGANVQVLAGGDTFLTDETGTFTLHGVPAGTQIIEVRQVGYEPKRTSVDISPHGDSRVVVVLDARAVVLDTVKTVGKKRDMTGFERRMKSGMGTYITRDDIQERGSIQATDILRQVPGVDVVFDGSDYQIRMSRAQYGNRCAPKIYVDGTLNASGADNINQVVNPNDIVGMEIYKGVSEVPVEYAQGGATCGVVLIWTKGGASDGITGRRSP